MSVKTSLLTLCILIGLHQTASAQSKKRASRQKAVVPVAIDSAAWRADHYIVNRDSAYMDPRIGLRKLMGGNRRFVEDKSIKPRQDRKALLNTQGGQTPFATIVGCSDSRVPNEIIFDQGVGDLFIVRTAGQVMAAASYGSIEYAHLVLGSKLIVVLGHQACGAVDAAVKRPKGLPGHISTLVNSIKPAAQAARAMGPANILDNAIRQNVLDQVRELRELEPVLAREYADGKLLIVGAVYNLKTGNVEFLPETLENLPDFSAAKK